MKRNTSLTIVWYLFDSQIVRENVKNRAVLMTFAGDRRSPKMAAGVKHPNLVLGLLRGGLT